MKNPNERIQTAAEVADQLRHWLTGRGYTGGDTRGAQVRGHSGGGGGDTNTNDRWQQLAGTSTAPPSPEKEQTSGETISSGQGDTSPMGSNNEDLTLAPIDEENANPSTSSSDATDVVREDPLDEQVLSRIEEEIGSRTSTSGSLVDLLEDQTISSTSTTGILLRRKRPTIPMWMWGLSAVAIVVVIAIFLAIIVF